MIKIYKTRMRTPKDNCMYAIPRAAINYSMKVLCEYSALKPSHEGLVYWAGHKIGNSISVKMVIAPDTNSSAGSVSTSHLSNLRVIETLSEYKLTHLGQVHTHPGSFIDHSDGDDEWAAFKIDGLLSLVIPNYAGEGMLPIHKCGIHRFAKTNFVRLSNTYIHNHFKITDMDCDFINLRRKD